MSPAIILLRKLPKLLCLECSIWQMFLSSSLTVSITERFLSNILSEIVIKQFFILFLICVISCTPSTKSSLASSLPTYPLSPNSLPNILSKKRSCFKGSLSSSLAWVMVKFKISPCSFITIWSLNPQNHPIVDFPVLAMPLNTLFLLMRLFLHTLTGVESMNEIPVHLPRQQVFKNRAIGIKLDCISSVNLLYETVWGNSFCICFCT